jgi:hypothetical protein
MPPSYKYLKKIRKLNPIYFLFYLSLSIYAT